MITDPAKAKAAFTRARRVPSTKGFEKIPPSVIKKTIDKVLEKKKKEPEFSFSAPPKDYVFLSNVKVEQPEWMGTIGIEGFVNCCGAGILWGFGGLRTIDDAVCFVREGTRRIAAQQKGMALAIINYSQLNVCQPALEANGYRCVSAATNPVHGDMSYIYLFVKVMGNRDIEIPKPKKSAA